MHPPLDRPHPKCEHLAKALIQCHEDNQISKFFGACNDVKVLMDKCFKEEKEEKRRANFEEAQRFKQKFEARRRGSTNKNLALG
mmetsp:Transcript_3861/g.5386  ORF Transcript_3861/g.5386 Transcript_3861/m.5386 type:complete len:84 (-) Transcript_3861:70-321(-)|eukprot:CAMPEP_0197303200 /NCGR_PEP_ID=MMETSP0890-20130614/51517_1 /TAXON_ID=44058 ORGANISM="Aureoumbra lagunensis, Strain CCMP1510" /NCGR_SAMPLE_ID=MMETSP0890 /ASSEMBLY_ACC=CAM_ASM_000533 /LENGTH=83 /DNA_ID=CAMNT_0042782973 /DNA_START=98 /DNA_END=349 /DNA_ORIENTATION=+